MGEVIKIRRSIYDILSRIARELGVSSPEEALEAIILEKAGVSRDMFGVDKDRLSPYSDSDRMEDRG